MTILKRAESQVRIVSVYVISLSVERRNIKIEEQCSVFPALEEI